jgi:hypothetical protein
MGAKPTALGTSNLANKEGCDLDMKLLCPRTAKALN